MTMKTKVSASKSVRIFVPVAQRDVALYSEALEDAIVIAGGYNRREIEGGWVSPSGETIVEDVDEYEFIIPIEKELPLIESLRVFAGELLAAGEQAVLVTAQGVHGAVFSYLYSN